MYSLNELSALSLLKSAEEEKTLYPGMPRGLIAVLFYYDSREQFANAFKTLVQARQGLSWTLLEGNEELSISITRYLKSMLNLNMMDKILDAITSMDLTKEVELLQQNRALGDARHRKMVLDKFKSVRSLFAEVVFCWSAQTPLDKDECRRIMAFLAKVKLSETGDGTLDHVTVTLLVALLYSIEAGHLLNVEDMTDALSSFPITADKTFVPDIHRELKSGRDWECRELKAVVQFAWAVSLANLRQVTNNIQITDFDEYIDEDELILAEALKGNVFKFLETAVFCERAVSLDPFYFRRFHYIMADFILRMPDKIKNMKTKADENAQTIIAHLREGLQVPKNLEQPFEQLLLCLSTLYSHEECQVFVNDYWCESSSMAITGSINSRQVALKNFVQLPRDFLPHSLFIPYVRFLTSLAGNDISAHRVYDYLRYNNRPGMQESNLSWDHFLTALSKYFQNLRVEQPAAIESIYRSSRSTRAITPQELEGLVAVLELLATVATHDEVARVDLSTRGALSPIELCSGLLTCSVPLGLKTQLLRALAAFAKSPSVAVSVWQCLEAAEIVPAAHGAPGYSSRGIRQDIEEVESSSEEFPLSQALVSLLIALVDSGVLNQAAAPTVRSHRFVPYLEVVKQQIFIPHDSRTYRQADEKWTVGRICCKLFHTLVMNYQPSQKTSNPVTVRHPGHSLVLDFVHDSNLLRQLLNVLHDAVQLLEQHNVQSNFKDLEETLRFILEMFLKILKCQRIILNSEENSALLLTGLEKLLMSMNPRTGNCDHLVNVAKLIGHHALLPKHAALACDLLAIVGGTISGHKHLMPLLTAPSIATATRQYIVQLIDHATLDDGHIDAAKSALKLFKTLLSIPGSNLSHFFFGFLDGTGIRSGELRTDLLEPGVRGFPRTALHAILSVLSSLPPQLSELAHSLLHTLATHHTTAEATLRYLSSRDFVYRSLSSLPVASEETPLRIQAASWILRIAALDLRYHASHKQRSQLVRLINLLVSGAESYPDSVADAMEGNVGWVSNASGAASTNRGVLLSLLEVLELNVDAPQSLQCQFLTRAPELIKACEEGYNSEINIELLYLQLNQVLQDSGTAGVPIAQKGPLEADVHAVLDHALARNAASSLLAARKSLMEAWGQLTEISVTVTPTDLLEVPTHRAYLHTITLELLRRVLDDMARSDLTSILISTLLVLITTLKTIYSPEYTKNNKNANYVSTLDSNSSPQVPSSLLLILRGLVDCVSRFRHSHQSVRANVYSSLLNFLTIYSKPAIENNSASDGKPSMIVATGENSIEQYQRESYEVVKEEMSQLITVLCCEATAGHHLCRMLSLTCLGAISGLETRACSILGFGALLGSSPSAFLEHLNQQGQLKRLLDGIELDDNLLLTLVSVGGDLRPLYVYESRCALLSRLAMVAEGARQLLQAGLMTRLSKLQILSTGLDAGGGVPLGAVKGALRICQSIISSLGSQDWSAGSQVADFLSSHINTISNVLQPPSNAVPLDTVALAADVVANTAAAGQSNPSINLLYQSLLNVMPHLMPPHSTLLREKGDNAEVVLMHLHILSSCLTCCTHHLLTNPRCVTFQPMLDNRNTKALTLGTLIHALKFATETFSETAASSSSSQSSSFQQASQPSDEQKRQHQQRITLQRQQLCSYIAESASFVLWRHLNTFLQENTTSFISATDHHNLSSTTTTTLSGATSKPLAPLQISTLKEQMNDAFTPVLPGLQALHEHFAAKTSHVAFLPAVTTRIRKMLIA